MPTLKTANEPLAPMVRFQAGLIAHRSLIRVTIDGLLLLLATPLALWFVLDGSATSSIAPMLLIGTTLVMLLLKAIAYLGFHIQQRTWSMVSFRDAWALAAVAIGAALAAAGLHALAGPFVQLPRGFLILDASLTLALLGGVRATVRLQRERANSMTDESDDHRRVLVVGAGDAGIMAVKELMRHRETRMRPIGYLDDDDNKQGMRFETVQVLGRLADVATVLAHHHVDEVLIALPSDTTGAARAVVDLVKKVKPGMPCKVVPGMYELLSGKVDVHRIRNVEIADLLGRPPVRLDVDSILGYIAGKRVLVTGAGGSIGSELVRQICHFQPAELILFGHGENSIYAMERELDRLVPKIPYHGVIGAIQNRHRLNAVFTQYRPDIVFHAAAHKHVPLMEKNAEEAVFNNIIGSRNLVDIALQHGVSHFVAISSDKAVNPTSIMGASKRIVEHLVKDGARRAQPGQTFVAVRFGNVLGSRGSVIPTFKAQIAAGGPVTITHPDMVRYFMTIPEAAQLVLQASGMGHNNEVFLLDMGQPIRIVDLARDLIRLSGLEPDIDIKLEYTGVRPGEKLSETLLTQHEQTIMTAHEKIVIVKTEGVDPSLLFATIERLQEAAMRSDTSAIRELLQSYLDGCVLMPEAVDHDLWAESALHQPHSTEPMN